MTSFHYRDLQPDYENGAFGGQIGKLLLRHFPKAYTYNSVYALFPFTTPEVNKANLTKLGIAHKYDFGAPATSTTWHVIKDYKTAESVFADSNRFSNVYGPALAAMTRKGDFRLLDYLSASTGPKTAKGFEDVIDTAFYPDKWTVSAYKSAAQLAKAQFDRVAAGSRKNAVSLDLVADVIVPVVTSFIATQLGVPIKTKENPLGLWTPARFYEALTEMWSFAYLKSVAPALPFLSCSPVDATFAFAALTRLSVSSSAKRR